MAASVVRRSSPYKVKVVLMTKRNISVECGMRHLTPKITIPYHNLPLFISWPYSHSKKRLNCVLLYKRQIIWYVDAVPKKHATSTFQQPAEAVYSSKTLLPRPYAMPSRPHYVSSQLWKLEVKGPQKYKWQKCEYFLLGKLNYKYQGTFFTHIAPYAVVL